MKNNKIILILFIILILTTLNVMAVTITGGSSSYSFTVDNCTATPSTDLTCDPANIRYQCDFGNVAFIDVVQFRINGINYLATQNSSNPQQFYLNYNKPLDTISNNNPFNFDRQQITDVDGNTVNANILVSLNHSCDTCEAIFTSTPINACQLDNTQLYQFTSSNATCQPSYNASQSCNYCTPYLVANTTSCSLNNTQTTTYQDLNFGACCQTTLLAEDCPTLYYPYNQQITSVCQYYQEDFTCNVDTAPVISKKINLNCELPSEDACCVVNIYQNQNTTRTLLQTSPEYKDQKSGVSLFGGEIETRTCFPTTNRLLNGYYTDKEIRPDAEYELEILCTTPTSTYRTITKINPVYSTPDQAVHRLKWIGDNPSYIILIIIIIIFAFLITLYALSKLRGK